MPIKKPGDRSYIFIFSIFFRHLVRCVCEETKGNIVMNESRSVIDRKGNVK